MKIALVNKYLYPKGGADISNLQMARLLRERGHDVVLLGMALQEAEPPDFPTYFVSPVDYHRKLTLKEQALIAARLLYSLEARRKMDQLIRNERPDVIHFNNIYHQLSPSVIDAGARRGVPMVMTLRDYKLTCPVYSHLRGGKLCEECRHGRFFNAFRFRCTHGSAARSLLNTVEMYLHRSLLGIYEKVNVFISPSRFLQRKVRELGFGGRVVHLSNCVDVEQFHPRYEWDGREIIYFGRLSAEKGLFTLLEAVKGLDVGLRLLGRGPLEGLLKQRVHEEGMSNVSFGGFQTGAQLRQTVAGCMFTVIPSEWYENNPRSVIESFALGKPVVGAAIGGIPELVGEGRGYCYEPGNHLELRRRIESLLDEPDSIRTMGMAARRYVEERLNAEVFYEKLMDIYEEVCRRASGP